MGSVRNNIIANYLGTAWISILSLLLIPLYLRVLGPEAYGLVGFFLAFRGSLAILDFGLSTYSTREVARRSNMKRKIKSIGSYVRTIEFVYWVISFFLCLFLLFIALFFPAAWFKLDLLSPSVVQVSQLIFSLILGINWPVSFYRGVLRGLERQVEYIYAATFAATFRGTVSVFVLFFISPTVVAFFIAQLVSSLVETFLLRYMVWRTIYDKQNYQGGHVKFELKELKEAWHAIARISFVSVLGIIITQADKIMISSQLSLKQLGFYTIAVTLAVSTSRLVDSIIVAIFPKFAASHIQNKTENMGKLYRASSAAVIFIYLPVLVCSIFFSDNLLLGWTHSTDAAINAGGVLAILVAAQLFSKLGQISFNFQLAAGNLKLLTAVSFFSLIFYLPILFFAIGTWGVKGAALSWLFINCITSAYLHVQIQKSYPNSYIDLQWLLKVIVVFISAALISLSLKQMNLSLVIDLLVFLILGAVYYSFLIKKMWHILKLENFNS